VSYNHQEQLKGTSAELLKAEPLGTNPKAVGALFYFTHVLTLPPGQWKVDCDCPGVNWDHVAVASATEWNSRPILGAGGLKVYNVVPGVRSDGSLQDGTCAVWIENTWGGNLKVRITIFSTF
jgi:hypothetical protein